MLSTPSSELLARADNRAGEHSVQKRSARDTAKRVLSWERGEVGGEEACELTVVDFVAV